MLEGVLFEIEEIGKQVQEKGIPFHVDAVQAVGKVEINLKESAIDFLSLSAHKFYGPKGVGALYIREGVPFRSFIHGGAQERGRRAGTENVAGIAGLDAASRLVQKDLGAPIEKVQALRDGFEKKLMEQIDGVVINGDPAHRLPNTSNIRIEGINSEPLLFSLDQENIFVSNGSACMSGAGEPSHVLRAMGLSDEESLASVRFSLGHQTTQKEIDVLIQKLLEIVNRLRAQAA